MGDEIANDGLAQSVRSISGLYYHRGYVNPIYGDWVNWYAWYPVRRIYWVDIGIPGPRPYFKVSKLEWRTYLLRRRVISQIPNGTKKWWEYTTMQDLMQCGA